MWPPREYRVSTSVVLPNKVSKASQRSAGKAERGQDAVGEPSAKPGRRRNDPLKYEPKRKRVG